MWTSTRDATTTNFNNKPIQCKWMEIYQKTLRVDLLSHFASPSRDVSHSLVFGARAAAKTWPVDAGRTTSAGSHKPMNTYRSFYESMVYMDGNLMAPLFYCMYQSCWWKMGSWTQNSTSPGSPLLNNFVSFSI
ncbi:uncharacterized protein RSE6_12222 [Rhynchosporium secalis]|uniref:Uncharacterized protein n=1 Tax=Rhynchosporium secalis TaxID=38038 RepID=A0A1E1MPX6_RHYSE|nr:uncharacterized protein RSE6_12222 [Rhynchosporium secalis]